MSLTDLVARLARVHAETIKVTDRATGITEKVTRLRGPLLDDLEHGTTGPGGAGGQPGSKVLINGDAIDLQGEIRGDLIHDLIRLDARIPVVGLADLLTYWHELWRDTASPAEHPPWVETLEAWETRIRAMVEPVKSMPVKGEECPLCGLSRIVDDEMSAVALWIEFQEDSPEETVRLVCKKCGPVVHGGGSKGIAAILNIRGENRVG